MAMSCKASLPILQAGITAQEIAFGVRQEHFMVEVIAGWKPDGSNAPAHRHWARNTSGKASPHLRYPAGYANLLEPHDREQAKDAYGSNGGRRRALKRRFDPEGVFYLSHSVARRALMSQRRRQLANEQRGGEGPLKHCNPRKSSGDGLHLIQTAAARSIQPSERRKRMQIAEKTVSRCT